ncbi:MAG: MFS transporter [Bacillota bacterium]|nr:MFS transporter [Bacillota bacterium]
MLFLFFVQLGQGMQQVTTNLWLLAMGYPASWLGRLLAVGAVAGLAGSLPLGWLGRRWGAERVFLLSGGLAGLTGAAALLWPRPQPLLAAAVAAGLAGAALAVLTNPLMAELEPPGRASLLFSSAYALSEVALVLGSLLGGGLPALVGGSHAPAGLRNALLVTLLVSGAALFPLLRLGRIQGGEGREGAEPGESARPAPSRLDGRPGLRTLAVAALLVLVEALTGAGAGLVVPYLNVFLVRRFGAGTGEVGTVFALGSVATALLALLAGRLAGRGRRRAAWVGIGFELLSLPLLLAAPRTGSLAAAGVVLVLRSGLMNAAEPLRSQFAMASVRGAGRTWLSALQNLAWQAAWAAATAWAGSWVDRGAFQLLFQWTALAYLLAAGTWSLLALGTAPERGGAP